MDPPRPAALAATGFYEAKRALWIRSAGHCVNTMLLTVEPSAQPDQPILLWVVSFRHARGGARIIPGPGGVVGDKKGPGPRMIQDDDGSPGDGEPGGESEPEGNEE